MNLEYLNAFAAQIRTHVSDAVLVTTDIAEASAALDSGQLTIWVTPPERATVPDSSVFAVEMRPIVLSSNFADPLAALGELSDVVTPLVDYLGITEIVFDSLSLGATPSYPAAQLTTTDLIERL